MGAEHPDLIPKLKTFGGQLRSISPAEAAICFRRALALTEASNGADLQSVEGCLHELVEMLKLSDQAVEAEPYLRRLLQMKEDSEGPHYPRLAYNLVDLAETLQKCDRPEDVKPLIQRAFELQKDLSTGEGHFNPAIFERLGKLLHEATLLPEAEVVYRRYLDYLPDDGPDRRSKLHTLTEILEAANRLSEAEPFLREEAASYLEGYRILDSDEERSAAVAATANYLRAARELRVADDEIYARMQAAGKMDADKFNALWNEVMGKNPKD